MRYLGVWLVVAMISAPALSATRMPTESWGRAGISLEQYRADALACGRQTYYMDVSQTDDAKAFVRGSRELDDLTQGGWTPPPNVNIQEAIVRTAQQYTMAKQSVQPERRIEHLTTVMQASLDGCLAKRGYVKFKLTQAQRKQLAKLPLGSEARRVYMYRLASDPSVLNAQSEPQG